MKSILMTRCYVLCGSTDVVEASHPPISETQSPLGPLDVSVPHAARARALRGALRADALRVRGGRGGLRPPPDLALISP